MKPEHCAPERTKTPSGLSIWNYAEVCQPGNKGLKSLRWFRENTNFVLEGHCPTWYDILVYRTLIENWEDTREVYLMSSPFISEKIYDTKRLHLENHHGTYHSSHHHLGLQTSSTVPGSVRLHRPGFQTGTRLRLRLDQLCPR